MRDPDLEADLADRFDAALADLTEFCRIASVSTDPAFAEAAPARLPAGQSQGHGRRRGRVRQPAFEPAVALLKERLACDLVVSADGAMWRPDLPSVTVASRGLVALDLVLNGAAKDLHSGRHGGSAPNPIQALARLVASLHDADSSIAVEGFRDGITPPDPAILATIAGVGFSVAD